MSKYIRSSSTILDGTKKEITYYPPTPPPPPHKKNHNEFVRKAKRAIFQSLKWEEEVVLIFHFTLSKIVAKTVVSEAVQA